jgi:hypothetical protein
LDAGWSKDPEGANPSTSAKLFGGMVKLVNTPLRKTLLMIFSV